MTVSSINGKLFSDLSAISGVTRTTLSAVNGQTISAGFVVPPDPGGPSPADLANFQLWLKGNNTQFNGVATGTEITTWNDSSGNARDGTGVIANTKKPRFQQTSGPNSFPAVVMEDQDTDGQGGYFSLPDFLTGYTSGNVFCVVKLHADPPAVVIAAAPACGGWGTQGDPYFSFSNGNIYDDFGSDTRKDNIAAGSLAQWRCYEVRTASGAWSNYLDGTQLHTTGVNTVAWSTTPFIAHTTTNDKFMNGWVAEVIFYSSVLSDSDRWNTVHTYLNNKYAFALPTS